MSIALEIYRILAACTSTLMLLSPAPTIWNVWKTKTTGVASIVPLLSLLVNAHNAVFYGYLTEYYFPIFSTFIVGDVLCVIYITVFYLFTHEKRKAHIAFLWYGTAFALLTLYGFLGGYGLTGQTRHDAGNVFGYLAILTNLILYSSPFEKVKLVLQHRSAVFINFHMVCAGTFNTLTWVTYTALSRQWIIFGPNLFCFVMGCVQIVLYLIFHPSTHPYDGPIPGVTTPEEGVVEVELGQLVLSPKTHTKMAVASRPGSPAFVALESPLEPLRAHSLPSKEAA